MLHFIVIGIFGLIIIAELIYFLWMRSIYRKHQKLNNNTKYYIYDDFYAIHHSCNNMLNNISDDMVRRYNIPTKDNNVFEHLFHHSLVKDTKIINLQKNKNHPNIISNPNYQKYILSNVNNKKISIDITKENDPWHFPLIFRIYRHYMFEKNISKMLKMNYHLIMTNNGIYFIKNLNKQSTICILTGTGGDLTCYIDHLKKLDDYNVIVCIYRGGVNSFHLRPALMCNYVKEIIDYMVCFNGNHVLIGHSMGGHVIQHLYEYIEYNNIKLNIQKEIMIESGCFLSMCYFTYITKYISFYDIYNILSSNSSYFIHNIIFSYLLKSFDFQMMLSSAYMFRGCRYSQPFDDSDNFESYIIYTLDDPLFNLKNNNIICDEIKLFSPKSKIISYPGYHGDSIKHLADILKRTGLI